MPYTFTNALKFSSSAGYYGFKYLAYPIREKVQAKESNRNIGDRDRTRKSIMFLY